MNWKTKALLQKVISSLPLSPRINYFFQRYISKSLPMPAQVFEMKQAAARKHYQILNQHIGETQPNPVAYEFGAGYDVAIPLALWHEGLPYQVVTDIQPLLKIGLVNDVLKRYGFDLQIGDVIKLKEKTGIEYISGIDAKNTGFATASFEFIHSTDTLEHIPKNDILPILQECYRLLAPGGIISCIIDLQDHYQYFDKSISPFNFYCFENDEWEKKYNNPLQYQNRLLANDYYSFFAQAGFAPIQMELTKASDSVIAGFSGLPLSSQYANKSVDELSNLRCHIWAEKPD